MTLVEFVMLESNRQSAISKSGKVSASCSTWRSCPGFFADGSTWIRKAPAHKCRNFEQLMFDAFLVLADLEPRHPFKLGCFFESLGISPCTSKRVQVDKMPEAIKLPANGGPLSSI